jgi:ABC-type uncharacterized transport system permease subunit
MTYFIQQTLVFCIPLMIVALGGVFSERSGIINIALEGIMVFGAFVGVMFIRMFLMRLIGEFIQRMVMLSMNSLLIRMGLRKVLLWNMWGLIILG